jgi:hypothetical protein
MKMYTLWGITLRGCLILPNCTTLHPRRKLFRITSASTGRCAIPFMSCMARAAVVAVQRNGPSRTHLKSAGRRLGI